MPRLTGVLLETVGKPTTRSGHAPGLCQNSKDAAICADCSTRALANLRAAIHRLEAAIAEGIEVVDQVLGDADFEPDADREQDEDFEPTLGWNEQDAQAKLWLTDGGMGRDGDDD
jgi:hypothetical protein